MGAKGGAIPTTAQPGAVRQLRVQNSAWGHAIAIGYGEVRSAGNILVVQRFKHHALPTPAIAGGKGVSPTANTQYYYTVDAVIGIAEGDPVGGTSKLNLGRATPGRQVITTQDGTSPAQGDGAQPGQAAPQPAAGIDPGVWKDKRVRAVLPAGHAPVNTFRAMHWHNWGTALAKFYLSRDGTIINTAFTGASLTHYRDTLGDDGLPLLNDNFPGIACVAIQRWFLGAQASLPNMNFPDRLLCQYNDVYGLAADGIGLDGTGHIYDADPACVLADLLTSDKHGAGWNRPTGVLAGDVRDFTRLLAGWPNPWGAGLATFPATGGDNRPDSWSAYCRGVDLLLSPFYDQQKPMSEILTDLAEMTNTAILWSEGRLKMIPWADQPATSMLTGVTYAPTTDRSVYTTGAKTAVIYDLGIDDFLPTKGKDAVEVEDQEIIPDHGSAGTFNDIRVEYEDRQNAYVQSIAEAQDEASEAAYGKLSHETHTYHEIKHPAIGHDTATRLLQRLSVVRNTYRFSLGWRFALLEPMDVVTLTEPGVGLDHFPVRIKQIAEDKTGKLNIEAEEFGAAFPAVAPAPTSPDVAVGEDVGGVIVGGIWSILETSYGNPYYVDLTGGMTSDYMSNTTGPPNFLGVGTPVAPTFIETSGYLITTWSVFYTRREDPNRGEGAPASVKGKARLRFFLNGVSLGYPDSPFELWFDWAEQGAVKVATGGLRVPARSTIVVEITYFASDGSPLPLGQQYFQQAFNWTIGWEP